MHQTVKWICPPAALALSIMVAASGPGSATALRIEPVLVELSAPAAAGTLTLHNDEDFEVTVQTRVFRWTQAGGAETLDPATEVAASPPIVTLAPGADYTVRVVRTAKAPVRGEESYRLWIDQLPDPQRQGRGVNLLIRQSIPVFFQAAQMTRANVAWTVRLEGARLLIMASNSGDERLRIAALRLRDTAGKAVSFGPGLAGYVLGRSSMTFIVPNPPRGFGAAGAVSIAAESNAGAVHATASVQPWP